MPIKLDCPRCNTHLQVPSKMAGGYVNCPQCKGRVWVDKNQPPPPIESPPPGPIASPPSSVFVPPSVRPLPQPPAPPAPPAPRKKVARFIAAESADSTLKLAADGKLPELHLDDGETKEKPATESASSNPLMLIGGLCVAALLWGVLIFSFLQTPSTPQSERKDQMRTKIEREYFGASNIEDKALAPYQVLLREAQRAHTRGDDKAERAKYRKVLDMLHAERDVNEKGLTGRRSRDKELEDAINVLLEK